MYILSIIPLTKPSRFQPSILTYYSLDPIDAGFLVLIPMRKKEKYGLVINCVPLETKKLEIKKADFQLKKITGIASDAPVLAPWQIKFGMWLAEYYYASLGSIFLRMVPKKILPNPPFLKEGIPPFEKGRLGGILKNKKQTLILVPQISFIQSTVKNLPANTPISIIHNKLTDKQRTREWQRINNCEVKYIIGTRSAIFMSFANLKKIIVKNEENPHYKSQKTPRFDARTAVIKLNELTGAKLIFESVAPRMENYYLLNPHPSPQPSPFPKGEGRGSLLISKKNQKIESIKTNIIDIQKEHTEKNFSIFSRELQTALKEYSRAKKQIILFSARRGGANFIICRDCQNVLKCPKCDKALSYHLNLPRPSGERVGVRGFSILICHACGHTEKPPSLCPKCNGHQIKFSGFGTEKLEMEIKKLFPKLNISRIDGDTAPKKHREIIDKFNNKEIQILIGTQVIFGYELNSAPLMAVVSLDILMHLPDFRSSEKIFQQITYLKNLTTEKLIIQTSSPENYAIKYAAASNYKSFFDEEIKIRKDFNYPPFSKLIKLIYRHANPKKAETEAIRLAEQLKKLQTAPEVLGPIPAFISKKNNQYYWNIILKLQTTNHPATAGPRQGGGKLSIPPDWIIDVEPENLL